MSNTSKLNLVKEFFQHLDFQHLVRDLELDWEFYKEQIYRIVQKSESIDKLILELKLLKAQETEHHYQTNDKSGRLSQKYHELREQIRD